LNANLGPAFWISADDYQTGLCGPTAPRGARGIAGFMDERKNEEAIAAVIAADACGVGKDKTKPLYVARGIFDVDPVQCLSWRLRSSEL
jgi:hypothetical protein